MLLEGVLQEAEATVYSQSCGAVAGGFMGASKSWDIEVFADSTGFGFVDVTANGIPQITLNVSGGPTAGSPAGSNYLAYGRGNSLNGGILPSFSSNTYYSATGQMMYEGATFNVQSVNGNNDNLLGKVIKDFYRVTAVERTTSRPIPVIYDWGLQSVHKNFIPQDKWWQRSRTTRSDGVLGRTVFVKDRLFSAKNGGVCRITIDITGTDDNDLFNETGKLTITKAGPVALPN